MIRAAHATAQAALLALLTVFLCLAQSAMAAVDLTPQNNAFAAADWTPGEAPDPSKNRVGVSGPNPNPIIWEYHAPAQQAQRIGSSSMPGLASGVHVGPNMYAYVRQNPWTAFDPLGLKDMKTIEAEAQQIDTLGEVFTIGFPLVFDMMNPFASDSPVREANREVAAGVEQARQEINDSPLPAPLKTIAKAGLATGSLGHSTNPVNTAGDLTELAGTVREQGVVETAKGIATGAAAMAKEDPEYAMAAVGIGLMTGKLKPVGGGNLRSPKTIKFSQNDIGKTMDGGYTVAGTAAELAANPSRAALIDPIRLVKFKSLPENIQSRLLKQGASKSDVFSLDNRRLAAARMAKSQVNTRWATQKDLDSINLDRRFSTETAGRGMPKFRE